MINKFKFWQVDSFTNVPFKGNPAAVFIHNHPIEDELMQNIAVEMNLSETAFIHLREGQNPMLCWFTPMYEIDLCGHATLAAAQIYFSEINKDANKVIFDTKFVGNLTVSKNQSSLTMNFPARAGDEVRIESIPNFVLQSLSDIKPIYARKSRDLMLVFDDEKTVLEMKPNFNTLLDYKDFIIVTAKSSNPKYDFISRFFCASDGILEDPVTGSAHCTLAPYWSEKLGKNKMVAFQASKRGGLLSLDLQQERLNITGKAVTIIEGFLRV
jgi:PhzF family phenazine biosynthesis protein